MIRSVKGYMVFDLLMLALIGGILEALVTTVSGFVLSSVPSATISIFILYIAISRWNGWGLVLAPIMALATLIGGKCFAQIPYFRAVYDWKLYLSTVVGFLGYIPAIFIFKKKTSKVINSSYVTMIGCMVLCYVLFCGLQFVSYRLMTSHNLVEQGVNLYSIMNANTKEEDVYNLCMFAENGFIFNLFGLGVTIIGGMVLRSQGVLTNAVQKLVDDKKNKELDRLDAQKAYRGQIIQPGSENDESCEKKEEEVSQKKEDSSNC